MTAPVALRQNSRESGQRAVDQTGALDSDSYGRRQAGLALDAGKQAVTAADLLKAVQNHHNKAAIVPEVTILDADAFDRPHDPWDPGPGPGPVTRRIDALMFLSLERTAIEIKVSVADYRRDDWHKRAPWARVCHRFVYVVPKGLLTNQEIPYGCGVWEVNERGRVKVLKKAIINRTPEPLPQRVVQTLAYRACGRSAIQAKKDTDGCG